MAIGSLTLTPKFDPRVLEYAANTTNATNKITVTVSDKGAVILITVNGVSHENGTSASWQDGENIVAVSVGGLVYAVIVTKE